MLIRLEVGMIETNCYIFADDDTKEGIVIDPGGDAVEILGTVKDNGVNIKYIVLTHGHWDHIGAVDRIRVYTGAKVLIHKLDADYLGDSTKNLSCMFGIENLQQTADGFIEDGEELKVGNTIFKVLHTPGHTPGGICLHHEDILFSGDTLFQGTIGRTDLPGGDYNTLINSIKTKLLKLGDSVVAYPGHGGKTTIGKESKAF